MPEHHSAIDTQGGTSVQVDNNDSSDSQIAPRRLQDGDGTSGRSNPQKVRSPNAIECATIDARPKSTDGEIDRADTCNNIKGSERLTKSPEVATTLSSNKGSIATISSPIRAQMDLDREQHDNQTCDKTLDADNSKNDQHLPTTQGDKEIMEGGLHVAESSSVRAQMDIDSTADHEQVSIHDQSDKNLDDTPSSPADSELDFSENAEADSDEDSSGNSHIISVGSSDFYEDIEADIDAILNCSDSDRLETGLNASSHAESTTSVYTSTPPSSKSERANAAPCLMKPRHTANRIIELSDDDGPSKSKQQAAISTDENKSTCGSPSTEDRLQHSSAHARATDITEISICPNTSSNIKREGSVVHVDWVPTEDGAINLIDSDGDTSKPQPDDQGDIKQESPDLPFDWVQMEDGAINLIDSEDDASKPQQDPHRPLGHSFLEKRKGPSRQRTAIDKAELKQRQQLYAAKALQNKGNAAGASQIFTMPTTRPDGLRAWANPPDRDDSMTSFPDIKRAYKAKKKAHRNTIQDDIEFQKARIEEKNRLHRLERVLNAESTDEESRPELEDNDEQLFIRHFIPDEDASNAGVNDDLSESGPRSKRQKTQERGKRPPRELRQEEYYNWLAGIEETLNRDAKAEKKATETVQAASEMGRQISNSTSTAGAKKAQRVASKKSSKHGKPTKQTGQSLVQSLLNGNVYRDAEANTHKDALPVMKGTAKDKAMKNLVASIPLEKKERNQALKDKNEILRASKVFGRSLVTCSKPEIDAGEDEGVWRFKGIKKLLHHHQLIGAAKMKEREDGSQKPRGGILADAMGLGKTLESVAAMIATPPAANDPHKCTLIVSTAAIISQWDDEIGNQVETHIFRDVDRYHATTRPLKGLTGRRAVDRMQKADIIFTTYTELIKSYPKCEIPQHIKDTEEKKKWWQEYWDIHRGLLHRVHFYRVILDEAHVIKNYQSQTSIACRATMAMHRWAISGTPIHNNIEELFPYFKFLRINHTGSINTFRQNFCKKDSDICNQRLHTYLDHIMIRRTHKDELLGRPLIKLPDMEQDTVYLEFSKVERMIYDTIEMRCRMAINRAASSRTLQQQSRSILIMFQRLRQMTSHIFMVQSTIESIFELDDFEKAWDATFTEADSNDTTSRNMTKSLKNMIAAKDKETEHFIDPASVKVSKKAMKEGDGAPLVYKFRTILKQLRKSKKYEDLRARSTCQKCGEPPVEPMVTNCLHVYCEDCLMAMLHNAAEADSDVTNCAKCVEPITESRPCGDVEEMELDMPEPEPRVSDKGKDKKRPHRTIDDNMRWIDQRGGKVLPSTKTSAIIELLERWLTDFPDQKIIIFSQYHLTMRVLGRMCEEKSWAYCSYHGKISQDDREKVIQEFRENKEKKLMITSLKCGGIGLNLAAACRVINVDLWFNTSIEQQAFCRVYRIGQRQKTYITRFAVRATVDERLIRIQQRKDKEIEAAIDDRSILATLSMEQLMSLFGDVRHDDNDQPFIYVDDKTVDPVFAARFKNRREDPITWSVG